jgi:hypothetical protein
MDLRAYFKGDTPANNHTPPKTHILELPDLFISSSSGVKRSRSTVHENIDDQEEVSGGHEPTLVHKILSPLEVRMVSKSKDIGNSTESRGRKRASDEDDDGFFSDDMEEMFLANKEPSKKSQGRRKLVETKKVKEGVLQTETKIKIGEHSIQVFDQSNVTTHTHTTKLTNPARQTFSVHTTHPAPYPVPHSTPHSSSTSSTPYSVLQSSHNKTPPQPPRAQRAHSTLQPIPHTSPQTTNATSNPHNTPPHPHTNQHKTTKNVTISNETELECKIEEQMETVHMWQNKCNALRKQVI